MAPPVADAQPDATAPEAAERPVDPDAATGSAQPDPTEPPEPGALPESPATPGAADAVADPEAANASDVVPDAGDPADRAVSHGFDAESDTGPIRFNIGAIAMPVPPVLAAEPENFPAMAAAEPPTPKASIGMRMLRRVGVFASAASIVGLIVGTTIPAYTPDPNDARAAAVMATQKLLASGGTVTAFDPGGFEAQEPSEMQAELNLLSADSFDNNTEAIVQYPFSHGVPLTDGFGWRDYPVAQLHDAQDFAAGNGAAVRSIADGVVIESGPVADGCGTGVRIQHSIDGQDVTSRYCHMQTDS
ncbi:peptidoglycan DD-metalloendopeptidase family protein, partial [Leucobacter sp. M11]|uniref:peptidoglycan DD-metalloendopeptidase family protein n=1 Tax=Leucobacter sp. M11 TaxID=2993565 RepID=UPI002D809A0E